MLAYKRLLYDIHTDGEWIENNNGRFKELISYNMKIVENNFLSQEDIRPFEKVKKYLFGELSWYLSGSLGSEGIIKYSKFWDRLKNKDGSLNSNYGNAVFYKHTKGLATNFNWCLHQLNSDKYTRRAIMIYKHMDELHADNKDFICTISHQFFIRDNHLISIVNIRSSDVIKGLTYDIPWWSLIQQNLYLHLVKTYSDLKLGELRISSGSVHYYEQDSKVVEGLIIKPMNFYAVKLKKPFLVGESQEYWEDNLDKYVEVIKTC